MLVRARMRERPATGLREPPKPRPWRGRPRSPYVLLTLAAGRHGRELLEISGPLMRAYARRIGADFRVIGGEGGEYPCALKWRAGSYLQRYERGVWIDADALVAPDCPSLLELVPRGRIGIHDELPSLPDPDWAFAGVRRVAASQGWEPVTDLQAAWNSGVYVADREHAEVFGPPTRPYPAEWCAEQWYSQLVAERAGVAVHWLPRELNWQWWVSRGELVEPIPGVGIYHYSGLYTRPAERRDRCG